MMLEHLGHKQASDDIVSAIEEVLEKKTIELVIWEVRQILIVVVQPSLMQFSF